MKYSQIVKVEIKKLSEHLKLLFKVMCYHYVFQKMPSFTYSELERVFRLLKTGANVKVTPHTHAQTVICQMELADKHYDLVHSATKRFKLKHDKVRKKKNHNVLPTEDCSDEIFLVIPDDSTAIDDDEAHSIDETGDEKDNRSYRVSLLEVERQQRYRRTAPIIDFLKTEASKNKVTVHELLGVVLKQMDYRGDRRSSSSTIAETLLKGGTVNLMPILPSCYLQQNLQLGRTGYAVLKNLMREKVSQDMPTWKNLRQYQNTITPSIKTDTHLPGVRFKYADALKVTLSRLVDSYGTDMTEYSLVC